MAVRDQVFAAGDDLVSQAADRASVAAAALALGLRFRDPSLLALAFTHPSALGARVPASASYQRLEFLGDRVLGLVVADHLYAAFPDEDEGALARRLAALASTASLVRVARALDLGRYLHVGPSEEMSGGREREANLADALEALIGALYRDGGYGAARDFVLANWRTLIAEQLAPPQDAKTALQEWAQGRGLPLPVYRLVGESGPAHGPEFAIEVHLAGHPSAIGHGRSKRAAEQLAAATLLAHLTGADHFGAETSGL